MVPSKGLALAPIQFQAEVLAFSGRELAPWNNCGTLRTSLGQNHLSDGNLQEAPGVRASESTRLKERTMGIESTSEVWESTKPFVSFLVGLFHSLQHAGLSRRTLTRTSALFQVITACP